MVIKISNTTKKLYLLIGIFLFSFMSLYYMNTFFNNLIQDLDKRTYNYESKIHIGEEIYENIASIKSLFYELESTTTSRKSRLIIEDNINESITLINNALDVLEHGGELKKIIKLNITGHLSHTKIITYKSTNEKLSLEVIDLKPKMIELLEMIEPIDNLLFLRSKYKKEKKLTEFFNISKKINRFYKTTPTFFTRMSENTRRLLYESDIELDKLKSKISSKKVEYDNLRTILIIITILSVIILGYWISRIINRDNLNLLKNEEKLRESIKTQEVLQNKTKQLFNRSQSILNSQESMIIIADQSEVIEANQKLFDITGLKDLSEFKLNHACVCELFIEKEGYLKQSTPEAHWTSPIFEFKDKTHKALMKDQGGNIVVFEVHISHLVLDDNEVVIATFSDVTKIEKMREDAEASQKAKSQFLANMSHEIRTPMNGISGFLQLLQKTNLDSTQSKYMDIVDASMNTLLDIINDILDFSKIESGNMDVELRQINPFIELEKSFMNFLPKAHEKDISYQIHISSSLNESYMMDYLHVHQVMQNLINNSIKFTHNNGSVTVKVDKVLSSEKTDIVKFAVLDSGIGIAKEKQAKILEAFSQADNSTTRIFGGTGLGLSISKSLVEIMGGELKINSEEGKGSEFYFELELEKLENTNISKKLTNNKIYLLLNDDAMRSAVKLQLQSFNLNYYSFHSISELLEVKTKDDYIITTNLEDLSKFDSNELKNIIYITNENKVKIDNSNVNLIESYNECPSKLYNSLITMGAISNAGKIDKVNNYNLNILIAEDYDVNRILIGEILSQYKNIKFTFVLNGQEAVDIILKEHTFDLIFMDINMPVLDGKDATKFIRKQGLDIPIVALTANALDGDKEKFMSMGMDDYLSKPINIKELKRVLSYYSKDTIEDNVDVPVAVEEVDNNKYETAISKTMKRTNFPRKVVLKLFKSYITSSDALLSEYKKGYENKDFSLIISSTHNIKSSSLTLGFDSIGNIAKEIEEKANKEEAFNYASSYDTFEIHFKELEVFFDSL